VSGIEFWHYTCELLFLKDQTFNKSATFAYRYLMALILLE